jgi:hypothetical protein
MIRSLMTALVLSIASVSFAQAACNTQLTLTCQATFKADYQDMETQTSSDLFADENWDEPSLANCASSVYVKTGNTSVRVYATIDTAGTVGAQANATQIEDKVINGQKVRKASFSNIERASSVTGAVFYFDTLKLPRPLDNGATDVTVKCIVK